MIQFIVNIFLPYFIAWILETSKKVAKKLIEKGINYVIEAEEKYGDGKGKEKAEYVKRKLMETFGITMEWILNVLNEILVAYAKRKGYIK